MKQYRLIILLLLLMSFVCILNSTSELNIDGEYNTSILNHPLNVNNNIVLRFIPTKLYKPNRNFSIAWSPVNLENAKLYYSTSPKGAVNITQNYTQAPAHIQSTVTTIPGVTDPVRQITTTANQLGIGVGVYYCVIHDTQTGFTSIEFELIIVSASGVITSAPANGTTITNNQTPTFSWQPIAGVPYYHIVVSDQPFTLSYDENDKLTVSGLNIIWMAITTSTSIRYGIQDPSGSFPNQTPPPLIHGKEYNWVVVSNFGNDPLFSSDVTGNPSGFFYQSTTQISPATLTSPVVNQVITSDFITFSWDNVNSAISYHIYLAEKRLEAGSEVFYPVWNQITTNNIVELNAKSILINAPYVWKVVATNENNASSISQTRQFYYDIPVGTLNITVRDPQNNPVGFASIQADPVDASMDDIPFTVDSEGREKKKLPLGQYNLIISKNGHETVSVPVTVTNNPYHNDEDNSTMHTIVNVILPYANAFFTGSVKSGNQNLQNVTIRAVKSTGEVRTVNSSSGNYSLAVTSGTWTISAVKSGYTLVSSINSSITSGQSVNLADLNMSQNNKNINGYVKLPNGTVLPQVTVRIQSGNNVITQTTNNSGFYEFSGLGLGEWVINWIRTGYTPPSSQTINIQATSPQNTVMSDAIMTPRANIVSGNVTNGTIGISNVTVTATPLSGLSYQATTNAYGQFTLNIPQGNYIVTASHVQYSAQTSQQVNVTVGQTLNGVNLLMQEAQSYITGTVTSGGNAVPNVSISAGSFSTLTSSTGFYSLPVVSGTYNVIANRTGYISTNQNNVSIGTNQTVSNINFSLSSNPAIISGQVILSGSGVSAAQITGVRIANNVQTPIVPIVTGNDGTFTLALPSGTYQLTAEKSGLEFSTISLTVSSGSTVSNQIITGVSNQATMLGTVYNDQGGVVSNANIIVQEFNNVSNTFSTVTNIYGSYQINVTANKRYIITASRNGFTNQTITMESNISPNTNLQFNFNLSGQNASIAGKITDQNNNNISSANIIATRGSEIYSITSNSVGNYLLTLSYGTWALNISKPGYTSRDTTVVLTAGQNVTGRNFKLNTNFANLNGTITVSGSQNSLANVTVTATNSLGGGGTAVSNQAGQYTINNLIPGNYTVTYTRNGYIANSINNLVLNGNTVITRNVAMSPLSGSLNISCNQNNSTLSIENLVNGNIQNHSLQSGLNVITGVTPNVPLLIELSKSGYITQQQSITVPSNQNVDLNFILVQATGQISGRVMNISQDGLANAQVQISSADGFSQIINTAANGNYFFANLPLQRTYTITATYTGYFLANPLSVNLTEQNTPLTQQNITMTQNNINISGVVRNQNDTPLANIPVRAVSGSIVVNATTNASGQFTLSGLSPSRNYTLSTQSNTPGYDNVAINVTVQTSNISNLVLTMPVHISSINGTITDQNTSQPVAGATIIAFNSVSGLTHSTTSQSNGSFVINNLFQGNFNLTISRNSYQTKIISNIELGYAQNLTENHTLVFGNPVNVSGIVKDTNDRLIANAPVSLSVSGTTLNTTTNTQGSFIFNNVPPFTNNLILSTSFPVTQYDNASLSFQTLSADITNRQLIIDVKTASVTGVISNSALQPLNLAQVRLRKLSDNSIVTVTTQTNGHFTFLNLYEGDYELRISRGSYVTHTENISLIDHQNLSRNISLTALTGTVAGLVSNVQNNPLNNVRLRLLQDNAVVYSTISADDGSFAFGDITAGSYTLQAEKTGYQLYSHINPVTENSVNENIILAAFPNVVTGTVFLNGVGVSNATVRAMSAQNQIVSSVSDSYGDYMIATTGFQRVWAETTDFVSYWNEITIPSGQTAYLDVNLIQSSTIPGRVTYNNQNIPGVSIIATNINSGRVFTSSTNQNGVFRLTGLPAATYFVEGFLDGYTFNQSFPTIPVATGQTADSLFFTVTFTGNLINGTAINANTGSGIPNVNIRLFSGENILFSTNTSSTGSFSFSNIVDGFYTLKANHNGFLPVNDINVSVDNGLMSPSVIQFTMTPRPNLIYGQITDSQFNTLPGASITVTSVSDGTEFSGESDENGNYSINLPSVGNYFVVAMRDSFYPSSPQLVSLTPEQTNAELNIQLVLKPAQLSGDIRIRDLSQDPPELLNPATLVITLNVPGQDPVILTPSGSSYIFSNIYLPLDQYTAQLVINATYGGVMFKANVNITLVPGENVIYNRTFDFIPGSVTISGYVNMRESVENSYPVTVADIYLLDSDNNEIQDVKVSNTGYYQFNSITEGQYKINIQAVYNFEHFNFTTDILNWTGSDIIYDHTFEYLLSKLILSLFDHSSSPMQGNKIIISSELLNQPIALVTNEQGIAQTEAILHSGNYTVKVMPQTINGQTWITPRSFNINFPEITTIDRSISLPLKYDLQSNLSFASTDNILISLTQAENYTQNVYLHYTDTYNQQNELLMVLNPESNTLTAEIDAQNRSGNISFYFRSVNDDLIYSNQTTPFDLTVTSEGIISAPNSHINPEQALLSYRQIFIFEVLVYDELDNDLNDLVDEHGLVTWALSDSTVGFIEAVTGSKRKVKYYTPDTPQSIMNNQLVCRVRVGDYTIVKNSTITVRDMKLASLEITGPEEVNNLTNFVNFRVNALSDSGFVMTLPFDWKVINPIKGSLQLTSTGARYYPRKNFIGKLDLEVSALDPIYENRINSKKDVDVYRLILPNNSADTLYTDNECRMYLPENMIREGASQIYLYNISVSPVQNYSIAYEVKSNVYQTGVFGNPNFLKMPDLEFTIDKKGDEELQIAWWDIFKLKWIPISDSKDTETLRETMPDWYQYSVLTKSLPLGLYDLKLLPNPFTPYNQIGENKGLQISFKISSNKSRYPKITCKIYNLQGTLVRTIVENQPLLKGMYKIGESNSLYWDGFTNENRMARNGRYIVHLIVEDSKDRKEYLKPVVLVK